MDVGQVRDVGQIVITPGTCDKATKVTLEVHLVSSACVQDNAWDFWVFPIAKRDFNGRGITDLTDFAAVSARYGAIAAIEPGKSRVVITDRLDAALLDYVHSGGNVVLLTESGALQHPLPVSYYPQGLRSVGHVVEHHPATNEFPHEGICAHQFLRLFGASVDALDLTTRDSLERNRFSPVIWGLQADFDSTSEFQWPDPRLVPS